MKEYLVIFVLMFCMFFLFREILFSSVLCFLAIIAGMFLTLIVYERIKSEK